MFPLLIMTAAGALSAGVSSKRNLDGIDAQASLDKAGLNRKAVNAAYRMTAINVNADRTGDKFKRDKMSLQIQSKQQSAASAVQNAALGIEGVSTGDIMAAEQIASDIAFQDLDSQRDKMLTNMHQEMDNLTSDLNTTASDMSLQHKLRRKAAPSLGESVLGGLVTGLAQGSATL